MTMPRYASKTPILIACVLLFLSILSATHVSAQSGESSTRETITIAAFGGAAPVIFLDENGHADGVYPDVLTAALTDLGYNPAYITGLSFPEAYAAVVAGEIDIMPALLRTPTREEELDFINEPVMVSWSQVFTVGGSPPDSILDLEGARVAVQENGQNGLAFRELMNAFDIQYEEIAFPDLDAAVTAAQSGDADLVVAFNTFGLANADVAPTSIVFAPTSAYLATSKGHHGVLLEQIDEWLSNQKLDERSEYNRILARWFGNDEIQVMPLWAIYALSAVGLAAAILLIIVRIYRIQIDTAKDRIERSETRFRTIFDVAADVILVYDASPLENDTSAMHIREANDSACEILGRDRRSLIGAPLWQVITPDDHQLFAEANRSITKTSSAVTQLRLITATGVKLPFEISLSQFSVQGRDVVIAAGRDVSDRLSAEGELRESLAAKEMLLAEIHHRVKNNLQTIASLVNIRLTNISDDRVRMPLLEMADRVHAMGLLHRMLYQQEDFSSIDLREYSQTLCQQIWVTHVADSERFRLHVDGDAIAVDLDTALPYGLLLTEAVSNSIKHGFVGREAGRVRVEVRSDQERATVTIADDGVGCSGTASESVVMQSGNGIGLDLIRVLADQLDGKAEIIARDGVTVRVEFPLRNRSVVKSSA